MEILIVMIILGWLFGKDDGKREDWNRYDVLYGGE